MIRVTRLAVEFVLELLADGQIESEILEEYPGQNASPVWSTLRLAWTAVAVFSHPPKRLSTHEAWVVPACAFEGVFF